MIDEKQLRLSTNPQVIATLLLIDEVRQLKEVLSKDSNLVFLNGLSDKTVEASSDKKTTATTQPSEPKRRKPREKKVK